MSILHLQYTLEEINNAIQFIKLDNCDFYKRSVTRVIALRTDDFLKIGFGVNKATINIQTIKNDLNALKSLYEAFFKLQRDKYGAHFQDLDLSLRLQTWSSIDLTTAKFFSEMPISIYGLFSTVPGYVPLQNIPFQINDISRIKSINEQHDIEKFPNISSDILSLTRRNSSGLIHCSMMQSKAGVLKSLELLIDYELAILKSIEQSTFLKQLFVKLFIVDLVSYADNFYTRSDILQTAIQYEPGLDHYVSEVEFPEIYKIIRDLKTNYKFEERLDELRIIRNKAAGHIDINQPVSQLQLMIDEFNLEKFENFYYQLKNTFRKICFTGMVFRTFALESTNKLHGVSKMIGLKIQTFDGGPERESAVISLDIDSEQEYELQFNKWLETYNDDARHFFYDCSLNSPVIEHVAKEILLADDETSWVSYDYRKVHRFFEDKLNDKFISTETKLGCINLLVRIRGTSYALNYILVNTYSDDRLLRKAFIKAFGYLQNKPLKSVFQTIKKLYQTGDFYEQYECLLALFRIDLECRRSIHGSHAIGDTTFSIFLKTKLNESHKEWIRFTYALALASEYTFGGHHIGNIFNRFYLDFFEDRVLNSFSSMTNIMVKSDKDKRKLSRIKSTFRNKWYSTFLALTAEFLIKKKHEKIGNNLFRVLYENLVLYATTEPSELHNYAVACLKSNDLARAISIGEFLIKDHAYKVDYYYFLLSLYLEDRKYEDEFTRVRTYVLDNFNLIDTEISKFTALSYSI